MANEQINSIVQELSECRSKMSELQAQKEVLLAQVRSTRILMKNIQRRIDELGKELETGWRPK